MRGAHQFGAGAAASDTNSMADLIMANLITFAVGDIHGCFDKLISLLNACDRISAGVEARYVFIGDYVDRGPDSRKVVDFLVNKQLADKERFVCLCGNHEKMLLSASDANRSDRDLMMWWRNGGEQTLDSYGIDDPSELPPNHLAWLRELPLSFSDQHRLYVHAGIRPCVPIEDQAESDLLWIREPFLSFGADHPRFVVHGHTPTISRGPDLRTNRINIDTGACFGGPLTAALFTETELKPTMFVSSTGRSCQTT